MDAALRQILSRLATGEIDVDAALAQLAPAGDLGFARLDFDRERRTGLAEVVFGAGKTPEQLAAALRALADRHGRALATRVSPDKAVQACAIEPDLIYDGVPGLLRLGTPPDPGPRTVAVVAAGTSDLPVAEEAAQVAEWGGLRALRVVDVGVAGLHRLLGVLDAIRQADAVIAVAGMEGALPTVLAGLVPHPVIAVPTSVGAGLHEGGRVPLMAMLHSCAAGLVVVNVDNGFGAAAAALRILRERT
jgi:NCAIR mutase (PurE)-related protein